MARASPSRPAVFPENMHASNLALATDSSITAPPCIDAVLFKKRTFMIIMGVALRDT